MTAGRWLERSGWHSALMLATWDRRIHWFFLGCAILCALQAWGTYYIEQRKPGLHG